MDRHLSRKDSFQKLLDQWPECVYLELTDNSVMLLDQEMKHLGSIAFYPPDHFALKGEKE